MVFKGEENSCVVCVEAEGGSPSHLIWEVTEVYRLILCRRLHTFHLEKPSPSPLFWGVRVGIDPSASSTVDKCSATGL
jgi:hypothetical protein